MSRVLTRRELFSELYRDTLKNIFGAYRDFKESEGKATTISCEEAGLLLGRKTKANLKKLGIKT